MKIIRDPSDLADGRDSGAERLGSVVTIGAFDGVHLGHRAVLRLVRELADARGLRAALVTFDRHPAEVVRPESAPKLLTTLEHRLELLDATGLLDLCLVLTFDEQRSREEAADFVNEVLVGMLHAKLVVVGADFHFGHTRAGNVPMLEQMGADLGFEVLGLGLVAPQPGSVPFSSTRVRELLAVGDVAAASEVLGRPHEVRGRLEGGVLTVDERTCMPAAGRYRGTCAVGDETGDETGDGRDRTVVVAVGVAPSDGDVEVRTAAAGAVSGPQARVRFEARIGASDGAVGA